MKSEIKTIVEKALQLPSNARASIAELLLESLDHEDDFSVSAEWQAEIKKRCDEVGNYEVEPILLVKFWSFDLTMLYERWTALHTVYVVFLSLL